MMVQFNDKHLEEFIREKLLISVRDSLGHRVNPTNDSIAITNTILAKIHKVNPSPLIDRDKIVKISGEVLKNFDRVSSSHYLAYHKLVTN
ncbi:MAG TPA: hypothetical protein VMR76_02855 [Candidatus Saccharimonadia bacterium]|nr:hypothetical protein [Candidatus Saccharimonadia bacterium]